MGLSRRHWKSRARGDTWLVDRRSVDYVTLALGRWAAPLGCCGGKTETWDDGIGLTLKMRKSGFPLVAESVWFGSTPIPYWDMGALVVHRSPGAAVHRVSSGGLSHTVTRMRCEALAPSPRSIPPGRGGRCPTCEKLLMVVAP